MKKQLFQYTIALMAVFFALSCNDFLKEEQYDFIGPDLVGDSDSAKEYWINGVYNTFNEGGFFRWGAFTKMYELDNDDITGPDWGMSEAGAGNFQGFWATDNMWTGPYTLIHRANRALLQIEAMKSLKEGTKADALGQMHFLRAFAYFLLVRAYGDVPIYTIPVSEGTDPNQPRKPIKEVFDQIIDDLKKAEIMMFSNQNTEYKKGRPAKYAASMLLAKAYLTMASASAPAGTQVTVIGGPAIRKEGGQTIRISSPVAFTHSKDLVAGYEGINSKEYFKLARDKALEVINSGEYDLFPNQKALWSIDNRNTVEHMFSLQAIPIVDILSNSVAYEFMGKFNMSRMQRIEGAWYGLRDHWYEIFEEQDKRVVDGVLHRWCTWADWKQDYIYYYYPQKDSAKVRMEDPYYGYKSTDVYEQNVNFTAHLTKFFCTSKPEEQQSDYPYPFLRFAEALLIFAEADNEYNGGPTSEAYNQLNRLRRRSEASEVPVMNQQEFRSFVLEERRRELALEGNRKWDLLRWGIYLQVMNKIDIDENNVIKRRENKHLLLPLPVTEIDANEAINGNNPGW